MVALLLSVALAVSPSVIGKPADREALKKTMAQVIETTALKKARVSVQVVSLEDGQVVFARDADELLNPASNVKLFTAAAALTRLGPEYRFETDFLTDAELKDGKAKVLYVRGKGDPSMNTERLYAVVSELLHAGLKEVSGDVVVDDSWYDGEREAPGFDQESGDRAYLAPTGALSLNSNVVGVYLRPSDAMGGAATVEIEPASDYFTLEGHVGTGTATQRRFTVNSGLDKDKVHQKLEVDGFVPYGKGVWSAWKKIDQPALYFGNTLKRLLTDRGVKVKGRVRAAAAPANAKMLYQAQSDSLDLVLKKLQKHSSNFVAEQLIKQLGAEVKGPPGTTAKGIEVVEEMLQREVGLSRGTYVMRNGSGLNDTNRFSAAQTNRLLKAMWDKFPLAPEYMSALGIAGKDGTLKYRFEGTDAVGRLRAKTGTLETVSALSGYVQAVSGERFVFSILVNDFLGRASTVVQHIDALGAAVAATGSAGGPSAAVATLTPAPLVGPMEELKTRLKTWQAFAGKGDKKGLAFLRTSWRSERDPAVRAAIAETLYQSDPREGASVRLLLDSASAGDEVLGRLVRASRDLKAPLPLIPSLVELGVSGNGEALARLFEANRALRGDEDASKAVADGLATCANEASAEFLAALSRSPAADRDSVIESLAQGFVSQARPDAPFFAGLTAAQGSFDPALAELAKSTEVALSQRIAEAKAPALPGDASLSPVVSPTPAPPTVVPGGTR
ncbi:MAG: D-alanyl-D-alanine carboxypeptidase/D-alanyl-D-alanine-endopeptidase [Myxococcaceae bacterium]|nr:D-alanyl-D-alanine carboxypeptidase/D-alanyl-D-alanine-endopeptidase [Myxococcaceae bacterium]